MTNHHHPPTPFDSFKIHNSSSEVLDPIDTVELDNLIGELDLFQREHEAKERERQARQQLNGHSHGHSEYQTPAPIVVKSFSQSQTNHNDSIISTSTAITHAFSDPDKNDKVSLSASLNYSITSNASMMTNTTLSDLPKSNCSDSEKYWNDNNNDLSADTGFENPSFVHLNDTNIVVMRDNDFPNDFYAQSAAEIVVLRCKDTSKLNGGSNNNSITDLNAIDAIAEQKQRLSSFRVENNNGSYASTPINGSPSHYYINTSINNNSIPGLVKSISNSFTSSMYGQIDEPLTSNSVNVNNNVNVVCSNKPAITPRPASLLSGIVESLKHFFFPFYSFPFSLSFRYRLQFSINLPKPL